MVMGRLMMAAMRVAKSRVDTNKQELVCIPSEVLAVTPAP